MLQCRELRVGQGLGVESFREQPWGVASLPLSSLGWGEVKQRGGRHRSSLGWNSPEPHARRLPQDRRECQLAHGCQAAVWGWRQGWLDPERAMVQLRSWAVMGHV